MANKRRNPPAQWPLPDVVDPAERLCVKVYVPNDPMHIAAFRGALLQLQSAYHWADDPTHKAKDVALVWREILRNMGTDNWGCGIDSIEFRQVGNCEIQYRIDGGSWQHMATLYDCARGAILDAIADGTIAAPSQQPGGGNVPTQSCLSYNITLKANQRWISPNPVGAGYTVTVENSEGAWSDNNTILSNWFCPPGTAYGLGICGNAVAALPGDPLQTANHMRLIGYCNGVYMDMHDTTYTIPAGTPQSNFYLQANDGSLADNNGEIRLKVTICNNNWCYRFTGADLAAWVKEPAGDNGQGYGSWNGSKWVTTCNVYAGSSYEAIVIYKQLAQPFTIESVNVQRVITVNHNALGLKLYAGATLFHSDNGSGTQSVWTGSRTLTKLLINFDAGYNPSGVSCLGGQGEITEITLAGTGTNPFGGNNCS